MNLTGREIAVVGMDCRFPGAANPAEFWRNIRDGVESITFFDDAELAANGVPPHLLSDPGYVKAQGVVADSDLFAAQFFGVSPREAVEMDPQHRLLLECAWTALEDAGYDPGHTPGQVGVFAGGFGNDYARLLDAADPAALFLREVGNEPDFMAPRVSFKLDLRGPSVTVRTACSTSLIAVHLAIESLLSGSSDLALAGGVTIRAGRHPGYFYQRGGIFSPDGHCRAFDAAANGTVIGEGIGLVVLKRLADAWADNDTIHALILGSATGNDGAARVGFSAPGLDGQARVIGAALDLANVHPESIGYVETHGSGTPMGDRIEFDALTRAFTERGWSTGTCAIGSVKSNIGHTHAAAGIAGLIKTVLALRHGEIPPSLNHTTPNPRLDFAASPFRVATRAAPWPAGETRRRAGVSSFGLGGAGAHVVLEEAPPSPVAAPQAGPQLITLSARSPAALDAATDRLADHLEGHRALALPDVAHTLQKGRRAWPHRRVLVTGTTEEAVDLLRPRTPGRVFTADADEREPARVAFLLPGLGDHYPGMGRGLLESHTVFGNVLRECHDLLARQSGLDLMATLYPEETPPHDGSAPGASPVRTGPRDSSAPARSAPGAPAAPIRPRAGSGPDLRAMLGRRAGPAGDPLGGTLRAHPAVFALEYALARQWMAWGVRPDALIGYSLGEYVAACLAGVLDLEQMLLLVTERARLIEELPGGGMLAVPLPADEVAGELGPELTVAAVNGPALCVVAGPDAALDELRAGLADRQVASRRLSTSHAFHSPMMAPVAERLTKLAATLRPSPPALPYLSNVTGTWITDAEATDPAYWARHLCGEVRFTEGAARLWEASGRALLEVGPGQSLCGFALAAKPAGPPARPLALSSLPASYGGGSDEESMLTSLGRLWLAGAEVDWDAVHPVRRRRVPLPGYPFERRRFTPAARSATPQAPRTLARKPDLADWFHVPAWDPLPPLLEPGPATGRWLLLTDGQGLAGQLAERLRALGGTVTIADPDPADPDRAEPGRADPDRADLAGLLGDRPRRIVHLAALGARDHEEVLRRGFHGLLRLARATAETMPGDRLEVSVLTGDMYPLGETRPARPEMATLLGAGRVWSQESQDITCRTIDVGLPMGERLLDALVAELTSPPTEPLIVLRTGRRWRRRFDEVRVPAAASPPREDGAQVPVAASPSREAGVRVPAAGSPLREGGTYLITGGFGGMGRTLAAHLASVYNANLVLTGRNLPRGDAGPDALGHLGARVMTVAADVTDPVRMREVVAGAVARFGALHGVIHAAGVEGRGLMQTKEPDEADAVLAPKVAGARAVLDAIADLDLDFVVLCSSGLAVLGGPGQADYCAANSYLDALAWQRQAGDGPRTISINWDAWQTVGMATRAVGDGYLREHLEQGISPEEGVAVFERVLGHDLGPQALVLTKDYGAALAQVEAAVSAPPEPAAAGRGSPRPYAEPEDEIEKELADIWHDLLGVAPVGRHDHFFELGGHSLLGIRLAARLRERFTLEVPLRALFAAPTVAEMAQVIRKGER
ncbi:SDR family NAD(P)-dependent oxidoreductase [Nonomuraea sp. NPDC050404]|uniref:type I polyketide synthase n=1 Tax=Nonomuraea sp. NPDC050404 TaxID=3155783 RepID=UPI0033E22421